MLHGRYNIVQEHTKLKMTKDYIYTEEENDLSQKKKKSFPTLPSVKDGMFIRAIREMD